MEEENNRVIEDKNNLIEVLQGQVFKSEQHIRMQTAYISLLELALKQYNIILDIRDGQIVTRQLVIEKDKV